jgi:ribokinase
VTAVGDDMFADNTIKNFASVGIDTTYVRRVPGRSSGVAPIMVEPSGENSILIVKGANADLSPADVERAGEALKTCDLILLQLEVPLATVYAAIAFGKRHGVRTVLNPAPATPELDPEKVRDVSYFIPNETELAIDDRSSDTSTKAFIKRCIAATHAKGELLREPLHYRVGEPNPY